MDYLAHYGVSVDNGAPGRGSGRYPKGSHGNFQGQSRDSDIRIKAGSKAYRVQSSSDVSKEGQLYVSLDKMGYVKYVLAAAVGNGVAMNCQGNDNQGRAYSVNLKIDNDLIAPSYSKTMDSFIKTVSDMGGAKKFANDMYSYRDKGMSRQTKYDVKSFINNYKRLSVEQCRDNAYESFAKTFMRDTKARNLFFNDLKQQGYNAIIDENDKRFGRSESMNYKLKGKTYTNDKQYTDSPLIVFDASNVSKTSSSKLTERDYDYFRDLYYAGMTNDIKTENKWRKKAGVKTKKATDTDNDDWIDY